MGHFVLQPGDVPEKPTAEAAARDALKTLQGLAEDAADRMKEILDNAEIPDSMKIAVINMVLERVYGRPEEMLRIESGERNVAAAERGCSATGFRRGNGMYLKDYPVEIPFDQYRIVIRKEKWVSMEVERKYNKETGNSQVQRKVIGQVVPLFPGKMYPNENYFSLVVPNSVPEEIRDAFLRRCERQRELAELKKDPERMMRQVEAGLRFLQEAGRKIKMEQKQQDGGPEGTDVSGTDQTEESEKFWFITDAHELEYVMKVFGDLYNLMEIYTSRNPKDTLDGYKAAMFNRILEELKLTMPEHRILQGLETIAAPGEDGKGMTYSDALMLLTWYKNCLRG